MDSNGTAETTTQTNWPIKWGSPEVLQCATEMLQRNGVSIDTYLQRVLDGDYGLTDRGDGYINQLRESGQRFSALFELPDLSLLYISANEFGRTIVCDWINH